MRDTSVCLYENGLYRKRNNWKMIRMWSLVHKWQICHQSERALTVNKQHVTSWVALWLPLSPLFPAPTLYHSLLHSFHRENTDSGQMGFSGNNGKSPPPLSSLQPVTATFPGTAWSYTTQAGKWKHLAAMCWQANHVQRLSQSKKCGKDCPVHSTLNIGNMFHYELLERRV